MGRSALAWNLGAVLLLAVALPEQGHSEKHYIGAEACTECHASITRSWAGSLHRKIMQPATQRSVEGNFAQGEVTLRGSTYLLQIRDGKYFITESDLTGKPWEHRVDYTLGARRIQHYLTTLPDGRIMVMPPSWDTLRKQWVHDLDIDNPEEDSSVPIQTWNKTCYSCHVSREQKNFDPERKRYDTKWQDLGVDCETCHGPGSEHATLAAGAKTMGAAERTSIRKAILNPARLDPARGTMVCARCHSFRDIYVAGYEAGANYYDYFMPVMEYRLPASDDPAYWPDGRPRWLSNEAVALWQSQCFLKGGATCATCHSNAHDVDIERNARLSTDSNALCTRCHAAIAANVTAHTHHGPKSPGTACIDCHMPATVIGLDSRIRDHSMSPPVPENTIRHGIPNACNLCHKDKDAEWSLRQIGAWYGEKSEFRARFTRRADAFALARNGNPEAIPLLLQVLFDPFEGALIRANAVGYLGSFPADPRAYEAVIQSFSDGQPLVRATAASAIRPRAAQREAVAPRLVSLLNDPVATVQMSAAITLVAMGVKQLPGEEGRRFEEAKSLYRARAELNSDDAKQQFAAGRFSFLSGEMGSAVDFFRASLKLDPSIPAQYDLALALAGAGDSGAARQILEGIPPNDPQYASAQRFLASLEASNAGKSAASPSGPAARESSNPQAAFLEGQLLYQNQDYGGALKRLEQALDQAPAAAWTTKARIYRAVCLEKLGRTNQAESAMQALARNPELRNDMDLQLAYAELLYETGRAKESLQRIDEFLAAVPKAPMAYFWRARVLLQLHRTGEAADAAEEAVRLEPGLAVAHNLLMKIYQLLGRTKDAEEQAQWLRDYERRKE